MDAGYMSLKEDVLSFMVLLGDFNARVGRSVELDDVIGMFGEDNVMLVVIDWFPF